jgi:hypothetical protein
MEIKKILLKNGLKSMLYENETHFKNNIIQVLAMKLNDCIDDSRTEVQKNLLMKEELTENTSNMQYFLSFLEAFKPGKFTFKDGSVLNINEESVKDIKELFEQLNPTSRKKLVSNIFESSDNFVQHIQFSKKVKELL